MTDDFGRPAPAGPVPDEDPLPTSEELLERVREAHFSPALFKEGYEPREVDDCLAALERALIADDPIGPVLAEACFTLRGFRDGYDVTHVDTFLRDLARDAAQEAALPEVLARPAPPPRGFFRRAQPVPAVGNQDGNGGIEEQRGFGWRRRRRND